MVAARPCSVCLKYLHDDKLVDGTWQFGSIVKHRGQPAERRPFDHPPCRHGDHCPKGSPEAGRELSEKNQKAYSHYQECSATGQFPDDPIVRRNAGIIAAVEKQLEMAHRQVMQNLMKTVVAMSRIG